MLKTPGRPKFFFVCSVILAIVAFVVVFGRNSSFYFKPIERRYGKMITDVEKYSNLNKNLCPNGDQPITAAKKGESAFQNKKVDNLCKPEAYDSLKAPRKVVICGQGKLFCGFWYSGADTDVLWQPSLQEAVKPQIKYTHAVIQLSCMIYLIFFMTYLPNYCMHKILNI